MLYMTNRFLRRMPVGLWLWPISLWSGLCLAMLAAPWLESRGYHAAASLFYGLFSRVCHQDPARSFALAGHPWAVCHRCSGIYLGLWLVSIIPFEMTFLLGVPRRRRIWVLAGSAPLLVDVFLQVSGLLSNTPATRFVSGLIFGIMAASLFVPAVVECIGSTRGKRNSAVLGGLS
jgi:uncharacterized membrane protein